VFNFNPRTREGCDRHGFVISGSYTNFNPRTREGCDLNKVIENVGGEIISIHAPVKGATARKVVEILFLIGISIHAPVKGAT